MDVLRNRADVFKGDQAAENGRPMCLARKRERCGRDGEMLAAVIEFAGYVAFARIDVLAVKIALPGGSVE